MNLPWVLIFETKVVHYVCVMQHRFHMGVGQHGTICRPCKHTKFFHTSFCTIRKAIGEVLFSASCSPHMCSLITMSMLALPYECLKKLGEMEHECNTALSIGNSLSGCVLHATWALVLGRQWRLQYQLLTVVGFCKLVAPGPWAGGGGCSTAY